MGEVNIREKIEEAHARAEVFAVQEHAEIYGSDNDEYQHFSRAYYVTPERQYEIFKTATSDLARQMEFEELRKTWSWKDA